jgi:hypothetical protein
MRAAADQRNEWGPGDVFGPAIPRIMSCAFLADVEKDALRILKNAPCLSPVGREMQILWIMQVLKKWEKVGLKVNNPVFRQLKLRCFGYGILIQRANFVHWFFHLFHEIISCFKKRAEKRERERERERENGTQKRGITTQSQCWEMCENALQNEHKMR